MTDEPRLVMLEDISGQPYVREGQLFKNSRARRIPRDQVFSSRIVAYEVLPPSAQPVIDRYFYRQGFWLREVDPHDPRSLADPYWPGYMPCEGVRPADLEARYAGRIERRYLGKRGQPAPRLGGER